MRRYGLFKLVLLTLGNVSTDVLRNCPGDLPGALLTGENDELVWAGSSVRA